MKFYKVFKKSNEVNENSILVPTGFCWENLFFGVLWATYKKIWDLVIINMIVIAAAATIASLCPILITIAVLAQVIISFFATDYFLKLKLIRAGYKEIDLVAGPTEEEALLRFLNMSKKP